MSSFLPSKRYNSLCNLSLSLFSPSSLRKSGTKLIELRKKGAELISEESILDERVDDDISKPCVKRV